MTPVVRIFAKKEWSLVNKVEVEVEKDQEQGDEIEFTIKNLSGRGTKR